MIQQFMDGFSLGGLFLFTVVLMLGFVEAGFRLGSRQLDKAAKQQASQVRSIMGAMLGLTAFMLAFTFASAQSHHEQRVANMVAEAGLLSDAFMQAAFLDEPERTEARKLLHQYVTGRLQIIESARARKAGEAMALIQEAESLHLELWDIAATAQGEEPGQMQRGALFTSLVQGIINMHAVRLQGALMNRISWAIWATLYLTGFMGMLVMGYQAGLATRRSPLATATLAVAFSTVMMLIVDLDRPMMSLFQINDQVMINLEQRMQGLLSVNDDGD